MVIREVSVSIPWWCHALVLLAPGYWRHFLNLIIFHNGKNDQFQRNFRSKLKLWNFSNFTLWNFRVQLWPTLITNFFLLIFVFYLDHEWSPWSPCTDGCGEGTKSRFWDCKGDVTCRTYREKTDCVGTDLCGFGKFYLIFFFSHTAFIKLDFN